jgi:hypothetical protein
VGRTYAVSVLRFLRFSGFPGWLLWAVVHIYFLIGFANRFFVLALWGTRIPDENRNYVPYPGGNGGTIFHSDGSTTTVDPEIGR